MQPAPRVRTRWFRDERTRTPADVASAVASAAWRLARHAIERLRRAGFDIDPGEAYFAFLAEFLAFEVAIADRIAYERLPADDRIAFTSALARRLGAMLDDNARELLAEATGAWQRRFVGLVNVRSDENAPFGCADGTPAFALLRAFGSYLTELAATKDRAWIMAQVVEAEAPDTAAALAVAVRKLVIR